jgi:hypothetical protein
VIRSEKVGICTMGKTKEPHPAKLFMSLMTSEDEVLEQGLENLRLAFGEIDFISPRFPFHFTDYYAKEMGTDLFRHFITFERLIPMASLPDVKRDTNRLEEQLASADRKRRINIDPGYLCLGHVVLGTTKAYTHRPYLREGIYADLTLVYRDKSFQPLEWTYPDYRQQEILSLFNQIRKTYAEILKGGL